MYPTRLVLETAVNTSIKNVLVAESGASARQTMNRLTTTPPTSHLTSMDSTTSLGCRNTRNQSKGGEHAGGVVKLARMSRHSRE